MRRQSQFEAFRPVQSRPGQREKLCQPTAQAAQIATTADIGKDANRGLGHRQDRPLGRDPIAARAGDPDSAAHRHPVHEGDTWLGVGIFEVVEAIFVEEEGARGRVMALDALGNAHHIAARAKAAALGVVDEDDPDIGIVAPLNQGARHVAHHLTVEAVQRPGPVKPEPPGKPFLERQYIVACRVHHAIIT